MSTAQVGSTKNGVIHTLPRITDKKVLVETRWLRLSTLTYLDPAGAQRTWDAAERTTGGSDADGVDILAVTEHKSDPSKPKHVILVVQYRPPLSSLSLEFPAGLVDAGETCEQAAVRELKEETGYLGEVVSATPILGLDAGMSSSNARVVHISKNSRKFPPGPCDLVDLDKPENQVPKSEQEDGEFIQTFVVPLDDLLNQISGICAKTGAVCDAKLYTFAWGRKIL